MYSENRRRLSILIWGYRYLFGVIDTYLGLSILIWGYRILFGTFWAFGAPLYAPTHKDSIDLSALVAQVLLWALGNLIGIPYCPGFFFLLLLLTEMGDGGVLKALAVIFLYLGYRNGLLSASTSEIAWHKRGPF